jgi:hypothetical protein
MARWSNPQQSTWNGEFQFVCFNDDCPYFLRGWAWMRDHYNANVSYRYRLDPMTGATGPLPVWSRNALKGSIIKESENE